MFGAQREESAKTEIVLSITPRIVRNPQRPTLAESEFDAGTEASLRSRGLEGAASGVPAAPAIQPGPGAPLSPTPFTPPGGPSGPGSPLGPYPTPGAGAAAPGGPGSSPEPYPTPGAGAGAQVGPGTTIGAPFGTVGGSVTGPGPTVPSGATTFAFQGPSQVAAGASFSLALSVLPDQPITSLPFSLGYDPKLVEISAVTEGTRVSRGR